MRGASLSVLVAIALAGVLPVTAARAADDDTADDEAPAEAPTKSKRPQNAGAALLRAAAAYEYGDINQVVDSARLITEGVLPSTPTQQTQALRFLGIGLYLTNRLGGAENAFTELLRQEPETHLDPTSTRPEVVAFFENLRRQQRLQQRSSRRMIWNFIPPIGQFQNDDNVRGWLVLTVGVASLATAATTSAVLTKWHHSGDNTYGGHEKTAHTLKTVDWIAVGVLTATYLYGVIDGIVGYNQALDDPKLSFSPRFTPDGGLGFTF
jgi:hypothetical protein